MKSPWRIPLSSPDLDDRDRRAVAAVLDTPILSLGPEIERFEAVFRARLGVEAAAVSNGTAGLYLALRALGVTGGDVITPSFGFAGTAHAIRLAGAEPRFVDIDPETLCIDVAEVESAVTTRTQAVIPVDIFGTPAATAEILTLVRSRGIPVIEDACESLGATRQGRPTGTIGHAGTYAFYANKQMTTGEGGMVVSSNPDVIAVVSRMRNQGRGSTEFEFGEGFNFRLSELQAALGCSQFERLDAFLDARARVAREYTSRFQDVPGLATLPSVPKGDCRSWFVFPVFVEDPTWRGPVRAALAEAGIQTAPYFPPIHHFPPYRSPDYRSGSLSVTEAVSARSFAVPFHNRLRADQLEEVVGVTERTLRALGATTAGFTLQTLLTPTP